MKVSTGIPYYIEYKTHILHIFPLEIFRCVLNSRNVHFSNCSPKTHIQKLDASSIRGRLIFDEIRYNLSEFYVK
jgi:hypothetical protein